MDLIDEILDNVKTIAVVGLSDNTARDSHGVSAYMQSQGYRIIPVNPALNRSEVLGEQSYDDLASASAAAQEQGVKIDLVDVFRRSEFAGGVTDDAIAIGAEYVWMQDGVVDEAAAERARAAGMGVVMDDCILRQHKQRRA
ncbi:MAG: CoA-binding protein [Chloroflexi bacterium]|nr:CoA-binding protein [Chloroflexota bacterium]